MVAVCRLNVDEFLVDIPLSPMSVLNIEGIFSGIRVIQSDRFPKFGRYLCRERASSNTSEKAKGPKDRGFASLAYLETYCKAACVVSSSTTQSHATVECGFRRVWMCEFSNSRRFFLSDLGHGFQWKFRNFLLFGFNYESNNCNFNFKSR
ncbi:hypothetical protein RIR_jg32416.t2 [Rhizophagus irregularis DAOM 181602=DAOM 197198]|nr:hypothetical protein RIR_jg32416.t2 [Rhizophagus irregularis DAOM 181602=DAOM 197198]